MLKYLNVDTPFTNPGSKLRKQYRRSDIDGPHLVEVGTVDQYAQIQSFFAATDYATLLAKWDAGDSIVAPRVEAVFAESLRQSAGIDPTKVYDDNQPDLRALMDSRNTALEWFEAHRLELPNGMTFGDFLNSAEFVLQDQKSDSEVKKEEEPHES